MKSLCEVERFRGVRVVKLYEELDIEMFNDIELVVFLVNEERDVQKARGLKRENTLIIECYDYADKEHDARFTLNYIDINIKGIVYSYIRNNQAIMIKRISLLDRN